MLTERPSNDLVELTGILANWVEPALGFVIYLFGSRVRGDHRLGSDVDVVIPLPRAPTDVDAVWWEEVSKGDFHAINAVLPGPLHILENDEPIARKVLISMEVYRVGQVRCIWMDPSPLQSITREFDKSSSTKS